MVSDPLVLEGFTTLREASSRARRKNAGFNPRVAIKKYDAHADTTAMAAKSMEEQLSELDRAREAHR